MKTLFLTILRSLPVMGCALWLNACGGGSSSPSPAPAVPPAPSGLSYVSPRIYVVGRTITALMPTVTGTVTSFSVSPNLPAGLTLNATSGQISGTPSLITTASNYVLTATNNTGSTTFSLSIAVNGAGQLQLEPVAGTSIGIGQPLDVFAALKNNSSDPYPQYLDAAVVMWNSSQPGVATVDSGGVVRGVAEGSTIVSGRYQTYSSQMTIQVGGRFEDRVIAVAGQTARRYSIFTPSGIASTAALPAILAWHGGGGSARVQASSTLLTALAQEQKIVIAFMEGSGAIQTFNGGNCCGSAATQNIDDVAFASAVIDDMRARENINAAKVYSTGFSNGGIMSHRLACELTNKIAGIAAVSGGAGYVDQDSNRYYACNPVRPIPVLHIHATNDRNYPFQGGMGDGLSATKFYSIDATITDWIVRNNLTTQATIDNVTASTTCYRYNTRNDANKPFAAVTLCKVNPPDVYDPVTTIVYGGGHSWPGGNRSPSGGSDQPVTDFNANRYLWSFLNN